MIKFKKKRWTFSTFRSYQFCHVKLGLSGNFAFLFQILAVVESRSLETIKKWTDRQKLRLRYGLRGENVQGFRVSDFALYLK